MGNEAHKARQRLLPLFKGLGLDIGCGPVTVVDGCDRWDWEEGDAQHLAGVPDEKYDWIFSSHLLEHVKDPASALGRWWKVLKTGGYLILLVPDEDLYEQGEWPSRWNSDHKHTFTLSKYRSWSQQSINCTDLLHCLPGHRLINLSVADSGYDYSRDGYDQTSGDAEASCQMIVQKLVVPVREVKFNIHPIFKFQSLDGSNYDPTT